MCSANSTSASVPKVKQAPWLQLCRYGVDDRREGVSVDRRGSLVREVDELPALDIRNGAAAAPCRIERIGATQYRVAADTQGRRLSPFGTDLRISRIAYLSREQLIGARATFVSFQIFRLPGTPFQKSASGGAGLRLQSCGPLLGEFPVECDEQRLILRDVSFRANGIHRAFRHTQGAINAFVGMNGQAIRPLVETVDRANRDAVGIACTECSFL